MVTAFYVQCVCVCCYNEVGAKCIDVVTLPLPPLGHS